MPGTRYIVADLGGKIPHDSKLFRDDSVISVNSYYVTFYELSSNCFFFFLFFFLIP